MTITEVTLIHLLSNISITDPVLCSKLAHAKSIMQKYAGRTFYYLQQVEDPTYIYIIGKWESLDRHLNDFIPSADNQTLLESLRDLINVEWLLHFAVPHAGLPLGKGGAE